MLALTPCVSSGVPPTLRPTPTIKDMGLQPAWLMFCHPNPCTKATSGDGQREESEKSFKTWRVVFQRKKKMGEGGGEGKKNSTTAVLSTCLACRLAAVTAGASCCLPRATITVHAQCWFPCRLFCACPQAAAAAIYMPHSCILH